MTDKKEHGQKLQSAGYHLVPIKAGEKDPRTRGWQNIVSTVEQVNKWIKNPYYGGFGVLGQYNPGIDIDVKDAAVVDKLVAWCFANIGRAPVRLGNAPRVLIPCAAPAGGLGPTVSAKYESTDGNTHQIEIKATGQQWVAYGVHPKTLKPYSWQGGELHSVPADYLPALTGELITKLFDFFESLVPSTWTAVSKGRDRIRAGGIDELGNLVGDLAFENYSPPLNLTTDQVLSMLALLDPDGHVNGIGWRAVGMALYHQYGGSDEGKEIFTDWSSRSVAFDTKEIEARWPSWGESTYRGRPITAATIVAAYKEVLKGKAETDPTLQIKSPLLCDWEKRFVLVELADGTEVHDASVPIHRAYRRTLRAFREHNGAYIHKSCTPEGDLKVEHMVEAWKCSKNTRHFAGYAYRPGADRFCTKPLAYADDNALYVNTFHFPPHPDEPQKGEIDTFLAFLSGLFPVEKERDWFLSWIARLIQNPSCRSFVTPINITPITGTGRGLLFETLQLLVGAHNCHDVSKDEIEGRFNGFLDKCLIAVIQEIKSATGEHKYQIWERLKSMLTDTSTNIQSKGQDSYTGQVYANFLMFSNNIDALPLDDVNERRIYAMQGAGQPITVESIDALKRWRANPQNVALLFHYLRKMQVDDGDFKRAPVTETKKQMVRASGGLALSILASWLADEAPKVFTSEQAESALAAYTGDANDFSMNRAQLGRALQDKGYHNRQIRANDGRRIYVWYHPAKVKANDVKEHYKDDSPLPDYLS